MSEVKEITYDYLNSIKYKDLESTLTELGVKEAWEGGKKKEDIIKDALSKLAIIKKLKQDGTTDEEIQKNLDLIKSKEQEMAHEALIEQQIKEEKEKELQKESFKSKCLSKEDIEKNISIIDVNLKNGVKTQREILLKKRKTLSDLLEEMVGE